MNGRLTVLRIWRLTKDFAQSLFLPAKLPTRRIQGIFRAISASHNHKQSRQKLFLTSEPTIIHFLFYVPLIECKTSNLCLHISQSAVTQAVSRLLRYFKTPSAIETAIFFWYLSSFKSWASPGFERKPHSTITAGVFA